jgi:hypothetical protein
VVRRSILRLSTTEVGLLDAVDQADTVEQRIQFHCFRSAQTPCSRTVR